MKVGEFIAIPTGPAVGQLGEVLEIRDKVVILQSGTFRLEVQRDILEVVEKAEEEIEAETRRPKARRGRDERDEEGVRDEKPRNHYHARSSRTPQPAVAPVTTRIPEPIIEKKEEPKVEKIVTQNTQPARVEPLYCPLCGNIRRKATDIVDGDCYRLYTNEAAIALAKGGYITIFDWVVTKAPAILTSLEEQYTAAKAEVEKLQKENGAEVYTALKRSTHGHQVPREVWNQAFRTQKDALWRSRGGNVKFARMKGLEGRIALLKSIIEKSKEPKPEPKPAPVTETAVTQIAEAAAEETVPAKTKASTKKTPARKAGVRKATKKKEAAAK